MGQDSPFPDGELAEAAELGAISDRRVRVWVRRPGVEVVPIRLEVEGQAPVVAEVPVGPDTDWTGAADVVLSEPAPERPFVCAVGDRALRGRLAPALEAHVDFAFGFGSCHQPFAVTEDGQLRVRRAAEIYPAMRADLAAADARFLLLIGDQLYADGLAPVSVRQGVTADELPSQDAAVAAYRRVTRGFFNEPGIRALREAFPTCCAWDDHDIFNNWGSTLHESPLDRRLFEAACRVYGEYQHARNPGGGIRPPPYDFVYRYGTAGFLVLDLRGARDYDEGRLLGRAQWERVLEFLAGREAAAVRTLFVVAGVPVAHAARWFAALFERLPGDRGNDVRDRWAARAFRASRDEFLEDLFAWQTGALHRQVILLSGDIHEADAVVVRHRRGPGRLWQFTSSALTTPGSRRQQRLNWLATRAPNLFESRFRFARRFLIPANNYGLVRLTALPDGGHRVEFEVRAWDPRTRQLVTAGRVVAAPPSADSV